MISVDEALEKVLSFVSVLSCEKKPLIDCLGQALAEDIIAPFDVPPFDNSAMDGYAVRSRDIAGASEKAPVFLHVIDEVAAGEISSVRVQPGTAIRIMTGAPLPEGADTVVPFEYTDEPERKAKCMTGGGINVFASLPAWSNVRRRGEDIRKGELTMRKGTLLRPAHIGVIASLGKDSVPVIRRPVVGILATGTELLTPGLPPLPGRIFNSNSYSLAGQVIECGAIPRILGIASDDVAQLSVAIHSAHEYDLLITSGGVSVGDYDIVKQVLAAEGEISFWTVRMKPGKPLAFGVLRGRNGKRVPHLGLPGNPVSSMVTFEVFARPAILKMMGASNFERPKITAVMEDTLLNRDHRRVFARVVVSRRDGKYSAQLTGPQGSGILSSMARANGIAVIPETVGEVKPGDEVEVIVLNWENI
jgi:molybdopterin molybdotransferase